MTSLCFSLPVLPSAFVSHRLLTSRRPPTRPSLRRVRPLSRPQHARTTCCAPDESKTAPLSPLEIATVASSALLFPVVAISEVALFRTGCGLPAGPSGLYGAAEGVGYLVVAGVVIASAVKKVRTGSGLRPGPAGVIGAVEGFAWLLALAGVAGGAYVVWQYGDLPNAAPGKGSRCFPIE